MSGENKIDTVQPSRQQFHRGYRKRSDMASAIPELNDALTELRKQGLTVRVHSAQDNTWHVADGGLYSGYAVSGDELIELRRAKKLNIRGIKELG